GLVARGIETWAADTAVALADLGIQTTLFAGGHGKFVAPNAIARLLEIVVVPCLQRREQRTQRLARVCPGFMWRWGLKSAYGWEQFSFWWRLWPYLKQGRYDILHVQDPMLAYWCRKWRNMGLLHTREILAHGTEEPPDWLAQFPYVQHLAPWHLEQTLAALGGRMPGTEAHKKWPYWVAIPNFVDTNVFRPQPSGEPSEMRQKLDIPDGSFVVGSVATIKKPHKRIDYLIHEFSSFLKVSSAAGQTTTDAYLLIAGAGTSETGELVQMATGLCGERIRFCVDMPRQQMPAFYRALDVFVLPSLFEMMPIAVLEALASGVPAIIHHTPQLEWMVGCEAQGSRGRTSPGDHAYCGGIAIDMAKEGSLCQLLQSLSRDGLARYGKQARQRAEHMFSRRVVIGQYVDYYRTVLGLGTPICGQGIGHSA
ncbi:MAG: glycosyltransferase family 4 protein, partial [Kiritimatiellae bacterium]|nr:glycosyltransferase family 4 protein [Kiritimatiellia bacterium]